MMFAKNSFSRKWNPNQAFNMGIRLPQHVGHANIDVKDWWVLMDRHIWFLCLDIFPQKGELPAGNTAVPSGNKAFPFRDAQIEKELNDLRQKSKDL